MPNNQLNSFYYLLYGAVEVLSKQEASARIWTLVRNVSVFCGGNMIFCLAIPNKVCPDRKMGNRRLREVRSTFVTYRVLTPAVDLLSLPHQRFGCGGDILGAESEILQDGAARG